jgi:cell division protein FtsI/penicillin-binding protein 2
MIQEFRHRRPLALLLPLLVAAVLVPILIGRCGMGRAAASPLRRPAAIVGDPTHATPDAGTRHAAPLTVDLERARLVGARYVVDSPDGRTVELTLVPALQKRAEEVFKRHGVAYGGAVFVSIPDGRVLAMTGHSRAEPERTVADLTLRPWAPAASVFKVITGAALLTAGGVDPRRRVCYHGGGSRLLRENIVDRPRLDRRCGTLAEAIGSSTNSIIAKLAHRHLDPDTLGAYAQAFGFNARLQPSDAFPLETVESPAEMPKEDLEFARTAAGFWHVFLSPLHGARIASAFANGGVMVAPRLVARVRDVDGTVRVPVAPPPQHAIPASVAREVGRMMVRTTRAGTARGSFVKGGRRALPFDVAGKTGTLSRARPYTHYNWFVGFAPADNPKVAFGVLVGTNGNNVKAAAVAREVLAAAHLDAPTPLPASPSRGTMVAHHDE